MKKKLIFLLNTILKKKLTSTKLVLFLMSSLWIISLLNSTATYYYRWHSLPSLYDVITYHLVYGLLVLPFSFANVWGLGYGYSIIVGALLFWPLVIFLHYKIFKKAPLFWFLLLSLIFLTTSPFWLISAVAMNGI